MKINTETKTLYERLKDTGAEIDSHCGDLYVKATPAVTGILNKEFGNKPTVQRKSFRNQIDGSIWYDLPFQYDPYFDRK